MDAIEARIDMKDRRSCPRWVEQIPGVAIRWGVVVGCGTFWTAALYALVF